MKEQFEWVQSWCDETQNADLPRVLLVGDSISRDYQAKVRELLRGVCYVDYFSTSYAIDAKIYHTLVSAFATDSKYDLIHFNNGLHGIHLSKRGYKSHLKKLLAKLEKQSKLLLATTTVVYRQGNGRLHTAWMKRVKERNAAMQELAMQKGYGVNDLYAVSLSIPKVNRHQDGAHYLPDGYTLLAEKVALVIRENL